MAKRRDRFSVVFITASSEKEARKIARTLVVKKLAACANIIKKVESIFRWKGKIERADEALLIVKTRPALFQRLCREVASLHSYEVPEIISFDIERGQKRYLKWLKSATISAFIFFAFTLHFTPLLHATRAYKICVLKSQNIEPYNLALDGFEGMLKEAGYEKGKNLTVSYYDMRLDQKEGERLLGEIKTQKPDLILTLGLEASKSARENVQEIPVIFSVVEDPVAKSLVKSMASSGNNLTGSSIDIPLEVQLRTLRFFLPNLQRVGIIYDPKVSQAKVNEAQLATEALGIQLVLEPVASYKEVPEAVRNLLGRIDALWLLADPTVVTRQSLEYIFVRTLWSKKAVVGFSSYLVAAGALFAVSYDYYDIGRQSGELAVAILKGGWTDRLPITAPRRTHLIINMKIARRLDLVVPPAVLKQAKEIIQ